MLLKEVVSQEDIQKQYEGFLYMHTTHYIKHMSSKLLFGFLLLFSLTAAAQPQWQWAKTSGTAGYTSNPTFYRQAIAPSSGGKVLWATIQDKKASYGQTFYGPYQIEELDAQGTALASLIATGRLAVLDIQADMAGNWYVLGSYYDTVRLSPTLALGRDSFGGASMCFLARLHAGTLSPDWLQTIGTTSSCDAEAFCVSGGSLYVPMDSFTKTVFLKYDATTGAQTRLWTQTGRSNTSAIQVDGGRNIYVLGSCVLNGPLTFNGTTTPTPASSYPWYVARYHADGSYHWHYYLNDITCTNRGLTLAGDSAIYLSGMLSDSAALGGYHFIPPPRSMNADYLLARLDSTGSLLWAQQRPVTSTVQGNINFFSQYQTAVGDTMLYFMSQTQGLSLWSGGLTNTTPVSHQAATIVGINARTGVAQWLKTVGGRYSFGHHIRYHNGSLWITGNGRDSTALNFDTLSLPMTYTEAHPFVAKMQVGDTPTSPTHVEEKYKYGSVHMSPNPARQEVMISNLLRTETVRLLDLTGKVLLERKATENILLLSTASFARGLYFAEIGSGSGKQIMRLVLE